MDASHGTEMSKRSHFWLRFGALAVIAACALVPRSASIVSASVASVAPSAPSLMSDRVITPRAAAVHHAAASVQPVAAKIGTVESAGSAAVAEAETEVFNASVTAR
jgi:hypothetical protein